MVVFFFKQKTAYEMRISDWSSDVCSSDLDTLAHPAGKFVRIGGEAAFGIGDLHPPEHVDAAAPDLSIVEPAVELQPLGESLADRQRRVERGHRFLEHHAHAGTADRAQVAFFKPGQFFSLPPGRTQRQSSVWGRRG